MPSTRAVLIITVTLAAALLATIVIAQLIWHTPVPQPVVLPSVAHA